MRLNLPASDDADGFQRHFDSDAWRDAAALVCARHRIPHETLSRSPQGENVIFFADERYVVKIYAPLRGQYVRERAALEFASAARLSVGTPEVVHAGELEGWPYIVMTRLEGILMREVWAGVEARQQLEIVSRLGVAMRELHARAAPQGPPELNRDWRGFVESQARASVGRQRSLGANPEWLESLPAYLEARQELLPSSFEPVLLHGDIHPGNVLLREQRGRWEASSLFDFGDSFCGLREYEFVAPGVLMVRGRRGLQREMLSAYGYAEAELDLALRARLMLLTILYECSDLRKYALRLAPGAFNLTLAELEAAVWTFADD